MRALSRFLSAALFLLGAIATDLPAEVTADDVPVPGGPASVRRLLGLDPSRPREEFFLDLHEALLAGAEWKAGWSQIARRRAVVDFADDLATFRRKFGRTVTLALTDREEIRRTRELLEWLGFKVKESEGRLSTESRDDLRSARRRAFFDAIAMPVPVLLTRLHAGERIRVAPADETAPLPFGLPAWRELLDDPRLSVSRAFLDLVKNVGASRLLVALHSLDPETRAGLRAIARSGKGSVLRDEDVLDHLARFPGALALSGDQFVLPGGRDAEPLWADIFGASPSKPASFLRALFEKDSGRGAYVVEVLQQLPEPVTRALLFGPASSTPSTDRIRKLYRAVEQARRALDLSRRDPYDFAHLARFLQTGPAGEIVLLPVRLDGDGFPKNEAELAGMVARGLRPEPPEDVLARLVRTDAGTGPVSSRAARRFLVVSSLIDGRPGLQDPGVVTLLLRGVDRFGSAYALLEDAPLQEPAIAQRYLFTLDRLDRRKPSRESEVAAALFQAGCELVAASYRSGSFDDSGVRAVFSALLDLPLFSRPDLPPARGETDLFSWLSSTLLPALDSRKKPSVAGGTAPPAPGSAPTAEGNPAQAPAEAEVESDADSAPAEPAEAVDESSMDERLTRGLVGSPRLAVFEWSGGHYRFDAASDEILRRRKFREKQRLATLEDLRAIHAARDALVAAAAAGDVASAQTAAGALVDRLALSAESGGVGARDDGRVLEEYEAARSALERLGKTSRAVPPAELEKNLAAVDAVVAERLLEALLGHVYAAAAGDPDDLYYEDPDFVRRHSFRTVEKSGRTVQSAFSPTELSSEATGGGSRVSGSLFGLADVLGLLHADQITYKPGASISNESIRSGLVGSVWRMSVARLDDDALQFVAASCRATEELAIALAVRDRPERFRVWRELAKDLVPRARLASLAELAGSGISPASLSPYLSPSDLYRIGRRLAREAVPPGIRPLPEHAAVAKEALTRLEARFGAAGARDRLAEFGPRAVAWAGRMRLTDLDLPAYETLAAYRTPQLFGDRLYDWKIAVVRAVADAGLPAAILPLVLPRAMDEMMSDLKMAFPYDWSAIVRRSSGFGAADLGALLDEGLQAGRLLRDHTRDSEIGRR
jgi:hypothetical protein